VEVRTVAGPDELLVLAGEYLVAREAEHNLLFGILSRLRTRRSAFGADEPYLAVLVDGSAVGGVVVHTPPYGPVLSELADAGAADVVAENIHARTDEISGVLGPPDVASRFARRWEALTGTRSRLAMQERIYVADSATAPEGVAGAPRTFTGRDRDLVISWVNAFGDESAPEGAPDVDAEAWLERQLDDLDATILLWVHDERPVSLAASGQRTPNGLRVGPVYTPPELRGRGFGTAVTAEVTARALEAGRRFCFLFTDLANPTSNAIYQRIGYRPVCDVDQWAFDR
jgi:predicted GNAT family acetyltransferase